MFRCRYPGHDSHYALVKPGGSPLFESDPHSDSPPNANAAAIDLAKDEDAVNPMRERSRETAGALYFDEVVILQEANLLPRYIVYYK